MADAVAWGCAETGVVNASGGVVLSGTPASGFSISGIFDDVLEEGQTVTITIIKDSTHWAVHAGVPFSWVYPDWVLDASSANRVYGKGTLSESDDVTVLGLSPAPVATPAGNQTLYVATTGSDTNPGTFESPFATIQYALAYAKSNMMLADSVGIRLADGTYSENVIVPPGIPALDITGNTEYPGNVIISGSIPVVADIAGAYCYLTGLTLSGSGANLYASNAACVVLGAVDLAGTPSEAHLVADTGGVIKAAGALGVASNSPAVFTCTSSGIIELIESCNVSLTGTRSFSAAFVLLQEGGLFAIRADVSFFGTAPTGKKYEISSNSVLVSNSKTLPGGTAGTTATGAQYI